MSFSAKVEYLRRSTSPSTRTHLHAAHWPSLQPCGRAMPCRNAALRTVSPSSTPNSTSTGRRRTVYALLMRPPLLVVVDESGGGRTAAPTKRGRSVAGVDGEARAVLREVLLPLLGGHLAQQLQRRQERVA